VTGFEAALGRPEGQRATGVGQLRGGGQRGLDVIQSVRITKDELHAARVAMAAQQARPIGLVLGRERGRREGLIEGRSEIGLGQQALEGVIADQQQAPQACRVFVVGLQARSQRGLRRSQARDAFVDQFTQRGVHIHAGILACPAIPTGTGTKLAVRYLPLPRQR
jgi:hypothetical protein